MPKMSEILDDREYQKLTGRVSTVDETEEFVEEWRQKNKNSRFVQPKKMFSFRKKV